MGPDSGQGMSCLEQFYRSNFDYHKFISALNEVVQKTKDDFVNKIQKLVGDSNMNQEKKEQLNNLRIKLALYVIEKFKLVKDIQVQNRTSSKQMAIDIWNLTNSIVDESLNNESYEVIKINSKGKTLNDSVVNGCSNNDNRDDLKKNMDKLLREMQILKNSNDKILQVVEDLKKENSYLKKLIGERNRLRNFNLYHNENDNTNSYEDASFEPEFVQNGNKKTRIDTTSIIPAAPTASFANKVESYKANLTTNLGELLHMIDQTDIRIENDVTCLIDRIQESRCHIKFI